MVISVHEDGMQERGDPHELGSGHKATPSKLHAKEIKSQL